MDNRKIAYLLAGAIQNARAMRIIVNPGEEMNRITIDPKADKQFLADISKAFRRLVNRTIDEQLRIS